MHARPLRGHLLLSCGACLLGACGGSPFTSGSDAGGSDATSDGGRPETTGTDAAADGLGDTGADGLAEAAVEGGADTGADADSEAGVDAGHDSGVDAAVEAAADAGVEAATDAGPGDAAHADAATDAGADGAADASDGAVVSPNVVFVTAQSFTGAMGGLAGLDGACQTAAKAAGLPGPFIALASSSTTGAASRVAGARGWVRTDGKPVADTASQLTSGKLAYPIDLDEHGQLVDAPPWVVATGTTSGGTPYPGQTCADWTSATSTDTFIGNEVGTEGDLFSYTEGSCGQPFRLVCLQTSQVAPVSVAKVSGRHAFLSGPYAPGGGLAAADARCQADATSASLSGTYMALLATSTASAASRFDTTGAPWVRPDGVPVFAQASDLSTLTMVAPPCVDAFGVLWTFDAAVWTGASSVSSAGSLTTTCQDWSSSASADMGSTGLSGFMQINGVTWFRANGSVACSTTGYARLVCLEK